MQSILLDYRLSLPNLIRVNGLFRKIIICYYTVVLFMMGYKKKRELDILLAHKFSFF